MKLNKQQIINKIEATQIRNDLPTFKSGDEIKVHSKIIEGSKTRIQKLSGIVIRVRGSGLNKTFILRRETAGINSEISFTINNPNIVKIEVVKLGKVRRNYISYMRQRHGKSARIKSGKKSTTETNA
ncbi:MAG: 50S ribosomal protein L19 [Mycoplasmataceae bacterium]|jgi:large subunit ribosomal protein L19|nr:50S ribosomal protein L19 [Mycoplasmataceae bacterium]